MAYEYERDEWRSAIRTLGQAELDENRNAQRTRLGIIGDPTDDLGVDLPADDNPDEAA